MWSSAIFVSRKILYENEKKIIQLYIIFFPFDKQVFSFVSHSIGIYCGKSLVLVHQFGRTQFNYGRAIDCDQLPSAICSDSVGNFQNENFVGIE
jgi:hypothetical protein